MKLTGKSGNISYFLLILAGILGNHLVIPFLKTDLVFGGFFAILTLQFFGLFRGVIAGIIISAYTIISWNHPYSFLIMSLEVLFIGCMMHRKKGTLTFNDTLYWLFFGIPVGTLLFYFISDFDIINSIFVPVKQGINAILCTSCARLFYLFIYPGLKKCKTVQLKEIMITIISFLTVGTSFSMLYFSSVMDMQDMEKNLLDRTIKNRDAIVKYFDNFAKKMEASNVVFDEFGNTVAGEKNNMDWNIAVDRIEDKNFENIFSFFAGDQELDILLLNGENRIIYSNKNDFKAGDFYQRSPGIFADKGFGIREWYPIFSARTPRNKRFSNTVFISENSIEKLGLTYMVESSFINSMHHLYKVYTQKIVILFILLSLITLLTELLQRVVLGNIYILKSITADLPKQVESESHLEWPESSIKEINDLEHNFRVMATSLAEQFAKIKEINKGLEEKIRERTNQLEQSEEIYRSLFNDHSAVKIIVDPESGSVLEANASAKKFYGWENFQPNTVKMWEINTEKIKRIQQAMSSVLGQENSNYEFKHRLFDGTIRDVEVFSSPVNMKGKKYIHSIIHDITDKKIAEKKYWELQEQIAKHQKLEAVGVLAGGVAHDFNNMLGVIIGYSEMALNDVEANSPIYHDLEAIRKAAVRSMNITKQLLAFARKQTIAPIIIDLNEMVTGMIDMLKKILGENISLVWRPHEGPVLVKMDPAQVDQILANLCINARDAIEEHGEIIITTSIVRMDKSLCGSKKENQDKGMTTDCACLTVIDTGSGMDEENLEHIFDPFFTTKGKDGGTGLGLATVYGIVKQNDGHIITESKLGEGSKFEVFIPLSQEIQTKIAPEIKKEKKKLKGTVFIVEDEESILYMTVAMLKKMGLDPIGVNSPKEALERAREHKDAVNLLLTDVIMPEMNGKEFARQFNAFHPEAKVVYMSGYTANIIAKKGILDEGTFFIQKPFTLAEFQGVLLRALEG